MTQRSEKSRRNSVELTRRETLGALAGATASLGLGTSALAQAPGDPRLRALALAATEAPAAARIGVAAVSGIFADETPDMLEQALAARIGPGLATPAALLAAGRADLARRDVVSLDRWRLTRTEALLLGLGSRLRAAV